MLSFVKRNLLYCQRRSLFVRYVKTDVALCLIFYQTLITGLNKEDGPAAYVR